MQPWEVTAQHTDEPPDAEEGEKQPRSKPGVTGDQPGASEGLPRPSLWDSGSNVVNSARPAAPWTWPLVMKCPVLSRKHPPCFTLPGTSVGTTGPQLLPHG